MDIPKSVAEKVGVLDRAQFLKTRDEYLRPSYGLTGLQLLREKAARERDSRELYRNRAPYELLQNADDVGATRAIFVLKPDGVCFAHDGQWFSIANFRSLADGWSDKDPSQCIGHKGLGFRSVLDITPAPHVLRVGVPEFFGFKFTWGVNNGHIQEIFRRRPELKEEYLRWTRHGRSACPVMRIPGEVTRKGMGGGLSVYDDLARGTVYGSTFTTLFWLPAGDPDASPQALDGLDVTPLTADAIGRSRLTSLLEKEVSVLLPFLSSLEEVCIYADQDLLAKVTSRGNRKHEQGDEIRVDVLIGERQQSASFFQMHGSTPIPPRIRAHSQTPQAVRQMDRASFRLSARLNDGRVAHDPAARFHVYFPTEEPSGFGLTVHGDFHVKPDRTRLMEGEYNEWLLGSISKKLANEFLTQLLKRYKAKSVLEALRPASGVSHAAAKLFQQVVARDLGDRTAPWVPTRSGLMKPDQVALVPSVEAAAFWEENFAKALEAAISKEAFLAPEADSEDARKLLTFAGISPLKEVAILDLIEECAKEKRVATWWYEIYAHLASGKQSSRWDHSVVVGRKMLPAHDFSGFSVPEEAPILCLPPKDDASIPAVPGAFASTFAFVNVELSRLLHEGAEVARNWFIGVFRVAQFEATDLLPKAITASAHRFYDGSTRVTGPDLALLWDFLKEVIAASRSIKSEQFWQAISRLPLPVGFDAGSDALLNPESLAPAFALYWPEADAECAYCARDVATYRRLASGFLPYASSKFGEEAEWRTLLRNAGVSGSPKRLTYVRLVGQAELPIEETLPAEHSKARFSGERQKDENALVLENLLRGDLWPSHVAQIPIHARAGRTLQQVTLLDGLNACVQVAQTDFQRGDDAWHSRLRSLSRALALALPTGIPDDQAFRRAARGGGGIETIRSVVRSQLERLPWAPSSLGPVPTTKAFLRFAGRRLVSKGTSEEELGDLLVPYVTAASLEEYEAFKRLGIKPLEDSSATTPTLIAFLRAVGERLCEAWAKEQILAVRSRWRLVRGAIQEAYRALNQADGLPAVDADLKLATRNAGQIAFEARPLYYAEPGSPMERAFSGVLPLLDADRVYLSWFEQLGIRRLPGEWVREELIGAERAAPSSSLRDAIVDSLAPYLLAVVIAKSEEKDHRDLVLRRLTERLSVLTTDRLAIKYTLKADERHERSLEFSKFYLHRELASTGGIRESHYTLFVIDRDDVSIFEVDGDALGAALAPVFFDGITDDLAANFPRIVSRYQHVKGDKPAMEQFLLESLAISLESQESARDDISGKAEDFAPIQPPPAAVVVPTPSSPDPDRASSTLDSKKDDASKKLERAIDALKSGGHGGGGGSGGPIGGVTRDQEARGRKGEEEFLRRIKLPGGWTELTLVEDTRSRNTGFDFRCSHGGKEVAVEVKTFAPGGRVVVTQRELQAASQYGKDYFLIGFLAEGDEPTWKSFILRDPLPTLLEAGAFDLDVTLQANAGDVFQGDDNGR